MCAPGQWCKTRGQRSDDPPWQVPTISNTPPVPPHQTCPRYRHQSKGRRYSYKFNGNRNKSAHLCCTPPPCSDTCLQIDDGLLAGWFKCLLLLHRGKLSRFRECLLCRCSAESPPPPRITREQVVCTHLLSLSLSFLTHTHGDVLWDIAPRVGWAGVADAS